VEAVLLTLLDNQVALEAVVHIQQVAVELEPLVKVITVEHSQAVLEVAAVELQELV
jgi:hypothetical protein